MLRCQENLYERKHVSFSRNSAQFTRRAPEVACWLRLGAGATTLRTATLALVHSTAEYCAPVWCHSTLIRPTDPAINDALWVVTGCLRPTPADNLPVLAGILPAGLRRNVATLSLACRAMEPRHLLHSVLTWLLGANAPRFHLRPWHPAPWNDPAKNSLGPV